MRLYLRRFGDLTLDELHQILTLRSQIFVVEQKCLYQDPDQQDQISFHLFLKEQEEVIGYLRMIPLKNDFSSVAIGRVCIKEEYRKRKLGHDLLHLALNHIDKQWRSDEVLISAQEYLIPFYKSFGFKSTSEVYDEDGIPHIDMQRK